MVMQRMRSVVQALEAWLGPGTSELSLRIGIHSGPVMVGILRGEKTRFQLFGDTMNTAARIESTGEKNCIHLWQQTATYLINAGKADWVMERTTLVSAKGKGDLQTYWLTVDQPKAQEEEDVDSDSESHSASHSRSESEATHDGESLPSVSIQLGRSSISGSRKGL